MAYMSLIHPQGKFADRQTDVKTVYHHKDSLPGGINVHHTSNLPHFLFLRSFLTPRLDHVDHMP